MPTASSCVSYKATNWRHLISYLYGMGYKRTLVLGMEVRFLSYHLGRGRGSSVGRTLDSHADNPGSSSGENVLSYKCYALLLSRGHNAKSKACPSHTMSIWYAM